MRYVNTDKMSVSNQSIFGVCLVYPGDKKLFLSQQSNLFEKYVSLPIFNGIPMTNNFDKSYIQLDDGIITYTTDDFFVILRDKNILRVNSLDLNNGDYLIMG